MGGDSGFNPLESSFWTRGGIFGGITSRSWSGQSGAMKDATNAAADQQKELLRVAQSKSDKEEATASSAVSRARQKALAAATAASGRASTIRTGSGGVIGSAPGSQKQLIGE